MLTKALTYTAVLVGTYLLVSHATGTGTLLKSGGAAYSGAVRTLQGR